MSPRLPEYLHHVLDEVDYLVGENRADDTCTAVKALHNPCQRRSIPDLLQRALDREPS